jgi:hypothetical protein
MVAEQSSRRNGPSALNRDPIGPTTPPADHSDERLNRLVTRGSVGGSSHPPELRQKDSQSDAEPKGKGEEGMSPRERVIAVFLLTVAVAGGASIPRLLSAPGRPLSVPLGPSAGRIVVQAPAVPKALHRKIRRRVHQRSIRVTAARPAPATTVARAAPVGAQPSRSAVAPPAHKPSPPPPPPSPPPPPPSPPPPSPPTAPPPPTSPPPPPPPPPSPPPTSTDTRPGHGYGDPNHQHTGPPGHG